MQCGESVNGKCLAITKQYLFSFTQIKTNYMAVNRLITRVPMGLLLSYLIIFASCNNRNHQQTTIPITDLVQDSTGHPTLEKIKPETKQGVLKLQDFMSIDTLAFILKFSNDGILTYLKGGGNHSITKGVNKLWQYSYEEDGEVSFIQQSSKEMVTITKQPQRLEYVCLNKSLFSDFVAEIKLRFAFLKKVKNDKGGDVIEYDAGEKYLVTDEVPLSKGNAYKVNLVPKEDLDKY